MRYRALGALAVALLCVIGGCTAPHDGGTDASDGASGPGGGNSTSSITSEAPEPTDVMSYTPTEAEVALLGLAGSAGVTGAGLAEQGFGESASISGSWQGRTVVVDVTAVESPNGWVKQHGVDLNGTPGYAVTPPGSDGVAVSFDCHEHAYTTGTLAAANGDFSADETAAVGFATAIAAEACS